MVQIEADYEGTLLVQVFGADGRLAVTADLDFQDKTTLLDLTNLSVGVYIVVGMDGAGQRIFQEKIARL